MYAAVCYLSVSEDLKVTSFRKNADKDESRIFVVTLHQQNHAIGKGKT